MSQLGMGVMLNMLCGDSQSGPAIEAALNKTIKTVVMTIENELEFIFDDDTKLIVFDDGQSCCENRYMTTDDDLASFAGAKLLDLVIRDAPEVEGGGDDCHEVQFLAVKTSNGEFVMETHNEHNGYYGGFSIAAR